MKVSISGQELKYRLTSPYGDTIGRDHPHMGIDIALPQHTELRSLHDGVVEKIVNYGDNVNMGRAAFIKFEDGTTGIYGHMSEFTVGTAQPVKAGQLIGYSGGTPGTPGAGSSTGAHLHFQMLNEKGEVVDPTPVIEQVANMSGEFKTGNILLEKYNEFADKVIGKELEAGNALLEALGNTIGKAIVELSIKTFDTVTFYLPEIMGMTTFICAGLLMFGFKPQKMIVVYGSILGGSILWRMFT